MENLPLRYYPLVKGDSNTSLTVSHDTNLSSSWTFNITAGIITSKFNYLSSALSVNGSRLASDASKFNISQTAMESGILTKEINFQYNFSDEGFYIHYLYLSDSYYLNRVLGDQGYSCNDHYYYTAGYLFLSQSLRLHQISLVVFPFILTTYSK